MDCCQQIICEWPHLLLKPDKWRNVERWRISNLVKPCSSSTGRLRLLLRNGLQNRFSSCKELIYWTCLLSMWCLFIDLFTGIKASRFPFIESSYEYFRPHDRIKHWICTLSRDWYVQPNTSLLSVMYGHNNTSALDARYSQDRFSASFDTWKWLGTAILFFAQIYDSKSFILTDISFQEYRLGKCPRHIFLNLETSVNVHSCCVRRNLSKSAN